MAKLMQIKSFVAELAGALNRKDGYIMGARGENPRTGYLDLSVPESKCKATWKPNGYYYNQYAKNEKQHAQALKWRAQCTRVWDCNGLAEGIYEICTGVNINSKARNNYAEWCNPKGSGMIPAERRVPGAAVFWSDKPKGNPTAANIHHVAYLYKPVKDGHPEGDWWIIEAKGVMYGVVKSKLYSRKPNFWGFMAKYYDYTDAPTPAPEPPKPPKMGDRDLRRGCKGDDVRELQQDILKLGYKLPKYGADGDYGGETENAVRTFQLDHGILPDGVMQQDDFAALFAALDGDTPAPSEQTVEITGDTVNVRNAPGTTGTRVIGIARKGEKYTYVGKDHKDGRDWYMIDYKGREGWVTSRFSKLVNA